MINSFDVKSCVHVATGHEISNTSFSHFLVAFGVRHDYVVETVSGSDRGDKTTPEACCADRHAHWRCQQNLLESDSSATLRFLCDR